MVADITLEVIFEMLFLIFHNINIQLVQRKLTKRSYTIKKVLSTSSQVEFINKQTFIKIVLNENVKAFIIHMSSFSLELIYLDNKIQIAFLLIEEITVFDKYLDFTNNFSEQQAL